MKQKLQVPEKNVIKRCPHGIAWMYYCAPCNRKKIDDELRAKSKDKELVRAIEKAMTENAPTLSKLK